MAKNKTETTHDKTSNIIIETLNGECPDCGEKLPDNIANGDECTSCRSIIWLESIETEIDN